VIGERVLEITVGSSEKSLLAEKAEMKSEESVDIMTVMSGKKLGLYLSQMTEMVENLRVLMHSFLNKERTESMVRIFDKLDPLLRNMNTMSIEVTKLTKQASGQDNLRKVMENLAVMSAELNKVLPSLNRENPDLAKHLALLTRNLASVSQSMKAVGPEIPGATRKGIEALTEATLVLKAMQRNFFLKTAVEEVKKEEAKEAKRKPAEALPLCEPLH
jgi:phospholipid/cholesterol/gamma-HCH transport system substrate-binding protein